MLFLNLFMAITEIITKSSQKLLNQSWQEFQKQELPVAAMSVNGSGRNEHTV
jgi:hypothetical protein